MDRLILAAVLLTACSKHEKAPPPSPLQDGSIAAVSTDAPASASVVGTDAPRPRETASAIKVVTGATAACALLADGSVRCWGGNAFGQLGDGTTTPSMTPVAPNVRGVKDLVLGDDLACALIDDSSVACWGKIGFGKGTRTLAPAAAPGVRDIAKIFAVGGAACGSAKSGALVCWGDVDARGHVTATGASHAPTPVPGLAHVIALTAHAALTEDHAFLTWTDGGSPTASGLVTATEVAERGFPCALTTTGEVACIADHPVCGAAIVLGAKPAPEKPKKPVHKPHRPAKAKPVEPAVVVVAKLGAFALPFAKAEHLAFDAGLCVQSLQDRYECVDVASQVRGCAVTKPWPAFVTIDQVSGSCARLANGTVRCGADGSAAAPVIAGVPDAIAISATALRGCALTKAHEVRCWEGTGPSTPVRFSAPN